jgi:glycosyltransferase involved in cell wall biosynthesis
MKSALILGRVNGAGLDRDANLLAFELRRAGVEVSCPPWKDPRAVFQGGLKADAIIHLERVAPWWWKHKSRLHILIPNQERFPLRHLEKLRRIDQIWCKTRHAAEIFSKHHADVHFIGFTSEDRLMESISPDYGKFLHVAGRSTFKNTALVLELWAKHPEWPVLTLVQHPDNAPTNVPANVDLIRRHLPDEELKKLQNSHGIHLCPSISEGWGHYIVEAMSCHAVIITTDGPPMNELVTPERGILVASCHSESRHLGCNYFVDKIALEEIISYTIAMATIQKKKISLTARRWFEENHSEFMKSLKKAMDSYGQFAD